METSINPNQLAQSYLQSYNPALLASGASQINKMALLQGGVLYPAASGTSQIVAPQPQNTQQLYLQQMISSTMSGIYQMVQRLGELVSAAFGYGQVPGGMTNPGGMVDPLTGQVTDFKKWQDEQKLMSQVNNGLNTVVGWGNKIGDYVKTGANILGAVKDGVLGVVSGGATLFGASTLSNLISKGVSLVKKWF
jgi:hypothetical protein